MKNKRLEEIEKELDSQKRRLDEDKMNKQLVIHLKQEQKSEKLEEELKDLIVFQENLKASQHAHQLRRMKTGEVLLMVKEDIYSHLLQIDNIQHN